MPSDRPAMHRKAQQSPTSSLIVVIPVALQLKALHLTSAIGKRVLPIRSLRDFFIGRRTAQNRSSGKVTNHQQVGPLEHQELNPEEPGFSSRTAERRTLRRD